MKIKDGNLQVCDSAQKDKIACIVFFIKEKVILKKTIF